MAITNDFILKGGLKGAEEAANNRLAAMDKEQLAKQQQAHDAQQNAADRDAKLAQLIKGDQLKREGIAGNADAAEQWAKKQGLKPGTYSMHPSESGYSIDPRAPQAPGSMLTPGQIEAEKTSAKKVADYEAGGGRSTSQKNIEQVASVEGDLKAGKRDTYDRKVGGLLNGYPTLMGAFAPAEKARRDKAYNAAMMLARQSDPNPTENQIRNIMGQIYDPSSDDSTNLERIQRFQQQQKGVDDQMETAAHNLRSTGFVMPGLAGNAPAAELQPVQQAPTNRDDKLRGLISPRQRETSTATDSKVVNGVTYDKVPGGWKARK